VLEPNFFALPIVKMLLIAVIFLAVMVEVKTAGTGVGALIGIVAAAVFFASQYVAGLISLYDIAVFLGGIVFIALEILTPGIGIFALIGILAVLASFLMALGGDAYAAYILLGSLFLAVAVFAVLLKKLPASRLWSKLVLKDSSTGSKGYVSAQDYSGFVGRQGVVKTKLRPSGTGMFGTTQLDIVSEGGYIEEGETVEVIWVSGSRIVVRKANGGN